MNRVILLILAILTLSCAQFFASDLLLDGEIDTTSGDSVITKWVRIEKYQFFGLCWDIEDDTVGTDSINYDVYIEASLVDTMKNTYSCGKLWDLSTEAAKCSTITVLGFPTKYIRFLFVPDSDNGGRIDFNRVEFGRQK